MNEAERRRHIKERQQTSTAWRIIHILGSLRLALTLLSTIAIACAIATFAESKFSSQVAQDYIYKAPWFLLWLGVLCINLIAATLTRWPWQRKHTGFIITHAGIITLLIGAVIGMKTGFEAHVTLLKDTPPSTRLIINETILQVNSPRDGAIYTMPFPVQTRRPTEDKPRILPVPDSPLHLHVEGYSEALKERTTLVASTAPDAAPGVALRFSSGMMQQDIPIQVWLGEDALAKQDFFGLASIEMRASLDGDQSAPLADVDETHVLFANNPAHPIVHAFAGTPSGIRITLQPGASANSFQLDFGDGTPRPLSEVLKKSVTSGDLQFEVMDFWADFIMRDGKPASASDQPNNPAVLVRVTGKAPAPEHSKPKLLLAEQNGALHYKLLRAGKEVTAGQVATGEQFVLGWADWQAEVVAVHPRADVRPEVVALSENEETDEGATPGILVRLVSREGGEGEARWIRSGRSEEVVLPAGDRGVHIGFGLRTHRIPFSIELLNFEVPRDEGTDTPANFISTVRFRDLQSGESKDLVSRMNHPASFPGGLLRTMTGHTYKFSQASWNPQNLNETTLQVLYDPGWMFKWIGSLMISVGITFMFYFKGKKLKTETLKS